MITIYKKHNYLNKNINIIKDVRIREYDIKSAGLNILYKNNLFTKEEYEQLLDMDKLQRNKLIGLWLRDNPQANTIMFDAYIDIRKKFMEENNLIDEDILSIKKDAIFVIRKEIKNNIIDGYEFVEKNNFTSYIFTDINKEFYYNKYEDKLVVKGYGNEIKDFQSNYYFKLVKEAFKNINNKEQLFILFIEFKNKLINKELPNEYYKDIKSNEYLFMMADQVLAFKYMNNSLKQHVYFNNNIIFVNNIINIFL